MSMVLNQVETDEISDKRASEVLDISLRHARRILAAYQGGGHYGIGTWQSRKKATSYSRC